MSDLMIQTTVLIMRKIVSRSWSCDVEVENMTKLISFRRSIPRLLSIF